MINKTILVGNLGKDAELKSTSNGSSILKFSLATTETWKDKSSGETKKTTQWHNVTLFGTLGPKLVNFLTKGSTIYVEGKLNYSQYDDKDGKKQYRTDIIANEIKLLKTNPTNQINNIKTTNPEGDDLPEIPLSHFIDTDEIPF